MFWPLLTVLLKVFAYCLLLLTSVWCWYQWTHRDLIRAVAHLPCPLSRLPILGHLLYATFGLERLTRFALKMSIDAMNKGIYTICFWCGPVPLVMVHGLEDIQKILTSSITAEKGNEMEFLNFAVKDGLLTAPGHIWRITRRHMNPLFHPNNVSCMVPLFNNISRDLVSSFSKHVEKDKVDVFCLSTPYTLKTVCNLVFGLDQEFDENSAAFKSMSGIIEKATELFQKRVVMPWLRIDAVFDFVFRKELKELNEILDDFTETPLKIAKANNELKKSSLRLEEDGSALPDDGGPFNLWDVYSVLQKKYPQFDDSNVKSEVLTIMGTGTDTVALALSSCIIALAQYQELQEKLYAEISAVVAPDEEVEIAHLNRMPYLDQVFKETLRWFNIVPYILRKPSEDLKLSSCTIPAGSTIYVSLYGVNMNPKIYPDPEKFDPERFSPENMEGKDKFTFLPFSGGPRGCIGRKYAYFFVKTMLVYTLRRFRLTATMDIHNMRRKAAINLTSVEGYLVKLSNRSEK